MVKKNNICPTMAFRRRSVVLFSFRYRYSPDNSIYYIIYFKGCRRRFIALIGFYCYYYTLLTVSITNLHNLLNVVPTTGPPSWWIIILFYVFIVNYTRRSLFTAKDGRVTLILDNRLLVTGYIRIFRVTGYKLRLH